VPFRFDVFFTENVFSPANSLLREILKQAAPEKLLIVIEEPIVSAMPKLVEDIRAYLSPSVNGVELVAEPLIWPGGEKLKNDFLPVQKLHSLIEQHGLSRHSFVAAIGGGALLDVAGFAAATAHRGIRHIRFPTTTLSQADGGVGVKNAVNAFGKKTISAHLRHHLRLLTTPNFSVSFRIRGRPQDTSKRLRLGLIRDRDFFGQIEQSADALNRFEPSAMNALIRRSAELHVRHISEAGDPFEFGSARPLDFGHWAAHQARATL
jgi:3-dehydroquinate synthase